MDNSQNNLCMALITIWTFGPNTYSLRTYPKVNNKICTKTALNIDMCPYVVPE